MLTFFNSCNRFFSIDERLACYCGFPKCRGVVNDTEAEERATTLYAPRSELVDWKGEWGKQKLSSLLSDIFGNTEIESITLIDLDYWGFGSLQFKLWCKGTIFYYYKIWRWPLFWGSGRNFFRLWGALFVLSQTLRKTWSEHTKYWLSKWMVFNMDLSICWQCQQNQNSTSVLNWLS